jgi:flagellar biosynthesis protein
MATTGEINKVVGLAYELGEQVPEVILKGVGAAAEDIVRAAQHQGVAVIKNAELAEQLFRIPIDCPIGRELFEVVAAILAHVFAVNHGAEEQHR